MKKIGLISDTHSHLDERVIHHLSSVDEIWHAGDVGRVSLLDELREIAPLRGVYGNIDDQKVRAQLPEHLVFELEGVRVYITHIGGYPPNYNQRSRPWIEREKPKLFITGHSHILKVMNDPKRGVLHMNPGAIGKVGFHKVRTFLLFTLDSGEIKDLKVVELKR